MITMFMVNYKENDSILTKKHSDPQSIQEETDWKTDVISIDHSNFESIGFDNLGDNSNPDNITFTRHFRFQNALLLKVRQPFTLLEALAKIGGLFVLLRVAFFIRLAHEYFFEKKLSQDLNLGPNSLD
jgi:hypothetical protein